MLHKKFLAILSIHLFVATCIALSGCATKPEEPKVEAPIPLQTTQQKTEAPIPQTANPQAMTGAAKPREAAKLPPPKPAEVQNVVARVYQKALLVDLNHRPNCIVGDFNGDGSQDIAVIAKPTPGKLEEINSELANWIVEDVKNSIARAGGAPRRSIAAPVPVESEETVLAVIHGVGAEGWRNPEAMQSFLLKSAVGNEMRVKPFKAMLDALKKNQKLPAVTGDAISETIGGQPGLLFWNGSRYAWFQQPRADELTAEQSR